MGATELPLTSLPACPCCVDRVKVSSHRGIDAALARIGIGGIRDQALAWRIGVGLDARQIVFKGNPALVLFVAPVVEEQRTGEGHWLRVQQKIQIRICESAWPSVLAVGNTVEIDVRIDATSNRD